VILRSKTTPSAGVQVNAAEQSTLKSIESDHKSSSNSAATMIFGSKITLSAGDQGSADNQSTHNSTIPESNSLVNSTPSLVLAPKATPSTRAPVPDKLLHAQLAHYSINSHQKPRKSKPKSPVKRYVLVAQNKDWFSAERHCQSLDETSHLVVIRNAREQKAVASYISKFRG